MKKIEVCYPGYSKKAVTFTLDDGNLQFDKKMIDTVAPYGIRGTFNLCSVDLEKLSADGYRELYFNYEISNHCKGHPYAFSDGVEYVITDEPFSAECADEGKIYKHPQRENFYLIHKARGWRNITTPEYYTQLIDEAKETLESVFGKDSVRGFVWPFGEQSSALIKKHLADVGYYGARKGGCTEDNTYFDVPEDRMAWSYNANHTNLLEVAAKYERYPDDGRLKFFAFGVHSIDFERAEKWGDVRAFAERYGNRPSDFWYATVGEIFAYVDAVTEIVITDTEIYNPTDITVYLKVDKQELIVSPKSRISI